MSEEQEGAPSTKPGAPRTFLEWIAPLKLWHVIVGPIVVVVISGLILAALIDDDPPREGGRPQEPPENVIEQVEQRDFWESPPQVFESAQSSFEDEDISPEVELDDSFQPIVATVGDLAYRGVDYKDRDIVLVGRVLDSISLDAPEFPDFKRGVGGEVRLIGARDAVAYIGEEFTTARRGEVVYASGRVAAVGTARDTDGRVRRAAYFLVSGAGLLETALPPYDELPQSIASAARAAAR